MVGVAVTFAVNYHRADAAQTGIYTIYPETVKPADLAENDGKSVELGVRFSAQAAGQILGMRYFGSKANSGTHTGTLWTNSGAELATATFSSSSSIGWQTVKFAKPISIAAKTPYVASYYAPTGHYAQQQGEFANDATVGTSPLLRASDGLYTYHHGEMPANSWHDAGYYVDVLFQPASNSAPSSSAPTSSSSKPSASPTKTSTTPSKSSTPIKSTIPPPSKSSTPTKTSAPPPVSSPPPASASPTPPPSNGRMVAHPAAGVPAGLNLTPYTGPANITRDGTVLDGMDITKNLEISAHNVVIKRSYIHSSGDMGIQVNGSLTISQSTISGTDNGIGGDNYSATLVEVTKLGSDGFKLGNNVHVDQSWCHDMAPTAGAHADCGQMQSGVVNMSVTNSWFDGGDNSALFLAPDLGPSANGPVTISGNVLGKGNYTLFCVDGNSGQYLEKNISITNNQFINNAAYGPDRINVPVTASGNTWFGTSTSVDGTLK